MLSAIDVDFGAVHIARLVSAEKIDRFGDFFRRAEAAERDLGDDFVGAGGEDRGVDLAGRNGVDADAVRAEIGGHFAGETGERGFGGGVGGTGEGMDAGAGDRGDVDDGSFRLFQLVEQTAGQHDGREEIDLEDGLPVLEGCFDGAEAAAARAFRRNTGIVDESVETTIFEAVADFDDSGFRADRIGEVDLNVILGAHLPRAIFGEGMTGTGDDAPAGGGKALDGGMADSAACTRQQHSARRAIVFGLRHGSSFIIPTCSLALRDHLFRGKGGAWSSLRLAQPARR